MTGFISICTQQSASRMESDRGILPNRAKNARAAKKSKKRQWRIAVPSVRPYPHLFAPLQIRHTQIANRVIFGPVCPTWVRSPHEGVFTEQAVAYYEERARTGIGMIILGGHLIDKDTL